MTDGRGVVTEYIYNANGTLQSRTEAAEVPPEDDTPPRTVSWTYDPNFPGRIESVTWPSVDGTSTRVRSYERDPDTGNIDFETISGFESTHDPQSFTIVKEFGDYTSKGKVGFIDPQDLEDEVESTTDRTVFTYNSPGTEGVLPDTRTDPLVGATEFEYTAFNRLFATTDPNGIYGVRTETTYDSLDRVTISKTIGNGVPDLVTTYIYNVFGDLACVKYPEGNGIWYRYDQDDSLDVPNTSAGRLLEVIRGTAQAAPTATNCLLIGSATPAEKVRYTLDAASHKTKESFYRSSGSGWQLQPDAETEYDYASSCRVESVTKAPGKLEASTTKYTYDDCGSGNLESVTEAFGSPLATTTTYSYDALNRLKKVTQDWGGTGGGIAETIYKYDVQDHLIEVVDAEKNVTSYEYSDRDLMTAESSSAAGDSSYTYNDHGQLISKTDGRGVVENRVVDAADRVTNILYPGSLDGSLDTLFEYETYVDVPLPENLRVGHLFETRRGNGATVLYGYDQYWRLTTDGLQTHTLDKNGNRLTTTYPQEIKTRSTYDFADRPTKLELSEDGGENYSYVVGGASSGATYRAFGPPSSIPLGNGKAESREFDGRYAPKKIEVTPSLLSWTYSVDAVGDVTSISQTQPTSESRTFAYQPYQHFLTCAAGPWSPAGSTCTPSISGSPLTWSYDRIGNRVTEVKPGAGGYSDQYVYIQNLEGKNSAVLDRVDRNSSLYRDYHFEDGFLDRVTSVGALVDVAFNDAGELAQTLIDSIDKELNYRYDGRHFLYDAATPSTESGEYCGVETGVFCDGFETGATNCWDDSRRIPGTCPGVGAQDRVQSFYTSDGRVFGIDRIPIGGAAEQKVVLYFGNRPIALWSKVTAQSSTLTYLTTDHLGTPILAMFSGGTTWSGGFEPFGRDWRPASQTAEALGIPLRLPGQWENPLFNDSTFGVDLYYNVHRWYESQRGRFTGPDPLGLRASVNGFGYVDGRPVRLSDPLGLLSMDPDSCAGLANLPIANSCETCLSAYEKAAQDFNDFFSLGWRQRKPECWQAIAEKTGEWFSPFSYGDDNPSSLSPIACMFAGKLAGTPGTVVACEPQDPGGAAYTNALGQIVIQGGKCRSDTNPLNTLFHERLHQCGAPQGKTRGGWDPASPIAMVCTGL